MTFTYYIAEKQVTSIKLKKMPVPKSGVSSYPKSSKVSSKPVKKKPEPVATDFSLSDLSLPVKTASSKTSEAKRMRVERDVVGGLVQIDRGKASFTHPNSYSDTLPIDKTYNGGEAKENLSEEQLLSISYEALGKLRAIVTSPWAVNYGVVYVDGTYSLFPEQVCYGAMNCTYSIFDDKPIAFFLNCTKDPFADDDNSRLTHWLLNSSPFADAFVDKDEHKACHKGQVIRSDKCLAYVVSAMVAFRTCLRNRLFAKNWAKLKGHMPESIAFCLAHYFQFDISYYRFVPGGGWESLFARTLSKEAVLRFANKDLRLFDQTPASVKPFRYGDFTSVWKKKEEPEMFFNGKDCHEYKNSYGLKSRMDNVFLVKNLSEDCREFLRQIGWQDA